MKQKQNGKKGVLSHVTKCLTLHVLTRSIAVGILNAWPHDERAPLMD